MARTAGTVIIPRTAAHRKDVAWSSPRTRGDLPRSFVERLKTVKLAAFPADERARFANYINKCSFVFNVSAVVIESVVLKIMRFSVRRPACLRGRFLVVLTWIYNNRPCLEKLFFFFCIVKTQRFDKTRT